jgi:transposase
MPNHVKWRFHAARVDERQLFTAALGIIPPWKITNVDFDPAAGELSISIDFERGARFPCPECATLTSIHDTKTTTWRHLDFFQFKTLLTVRHPRTKCAEHGVLKVTVPWARKGSGFSFLFEAMIISLAQHVPIAVLARHLREHDTKLWRIVEHHVEEARKRADFSKVKDIGVDETSARKRHKYVTFFMELQEPRVLFGTSGKGHKTFEEFENDLHQHGGSVENIENICMDMSKPFIQGAQERFPHAAITFDKFHVVKMLNDAMDKVRRQERKKHKGLKRSKMLWLRNSKRLSEDQRERIAELAAQFPETALAYQLKESFLLLYEQEPEVAEDYLEIWVAWAEECGLPPFEEIALTVQRHWTGIVNWFRSRIANGILEATNSLIQAARAKARGYRNDHTMITMAYLIAGRLSYRLPT